jgi:peptidoglycan/LPS O-acetylase OafA/YrhL
MRIKSLDSIRGLAAMFIVLYHYTTRYNQMFNSNDGFSFWFGHLWVPVFFVLSGFVIHLTIDRSKNAIGFLKKRFYRLYPTYWLSIIITLFFLLISKFYQKPEFNLSSSDVLMNFTMWHQFFGFEHIDGSYWSLLPELLFYISMAALFWTKLLTHFYYVNVALISLGIIHFYFPISIIGKILDLDYVLLFFIGICFYRLKNDKSLKLEHFLIFVNLIVASFLYQRVQPNNNIKLILISFTIIVFIYYCFLWGKLNWLGNIKILIFLGNISYALYLVHHVVGYTIINFFEVNFDLKRLGVLCAIILSVFIAYILTYKLEPIFRVKFLKLSSKSVI